ncbi:MAG: tRNA (N(6)-L-threonylcarbamoyladenosine(37)-C(2))-methylthiotransferase [Candidatus Methanoplasma sp.]|jgi:MiaB/RimO family radical SAM methylthiotransferase|nr:tRNA (N(6)-L-threonylcarbamoyladenosine(37)-C(2))-methylthiotransferase [Candidatus Methanoplasma sp.]
MKYYVESYGCTMNYGEGDRLSERMGAMGHESVAAVEEADIVILNTCTVVDTTEKRMLRRMSDLRRMGKEVIVAGCMAKVQSGRIDIRLPGCLIIPPDEYGDFSSAVQGRYGCGCSPASENAVGNIIPIAQGCLGDCSYCITKFARGRLKSYPEEEIFDRFGRMVDSGVKEVLVTAQDSACYGLDRGTDLVGLLRGMLEKEGDYRIRVGMMNPNMLEPISNGVAEIFDDPRVYRFLHVPVQSGSDSILEAMNRRYTADRFMTLVGKMRSRHPDISIATDIISGFPGETDADHEASVRLIEELRADTVNITRFSARPGTEAADMEQVHGRVAKERSARLTEVKNRVETEVNSESVGKRFRILVTEQGKPGTVIARTANYRPVAIASDLPIGSFADAEITGCASTYLIGRML